MKNETILPFANEAKKLKNDFKKLIDEMDDEAFIEFMFFVMESGISEEYDEEFEESSEDFENSFSGEMVNFKCPECKKISAYPVEIIDEIYEATKKEPKVECYYCDTKKASPIHYKAPNGKIFEN